jgi:membrane-bound serine protease (ClpP class)
MSTFGIALLSLGAALAVAEAHVVSYGILGTAAIAAIAAGLALIVDGAGAGLAVGLAVGLSAGAIAAVYGTFVLARVISVRRIPVRGGQAGVVGHRGEARDAGRVLVDGALWRARVWEPEEEPELRAGEAVVVERVDGLTLTVRRAEEWEVAP